MRGLLGINKGGISLVANSGKRSEDGATVCSILDQLLCHQIIVTGGRAVNIRWP